MSRPRPRSLAPTTCQTMTHTPPTPAAIRGNSSLWASVRAALSLATGASKLGTWAFPRPAATRREIAATPDALQHREKILKRVIWGRLDTAIGAQGNRIEG